MLSVDKQLERLVGECIKIVKKRGTEKLNLITYTFDCQHGTACYATMKRPPAPSFHMPFPHCTIFANCFHDQPLHHSISFSNNACLVIIMTYSNLFLICSGIFYVSYLGGIYFFFTSLKEFEIVCITNFSSFLGIDKGTSETFLSPGLIWDL